MNDDVDKANAMIQREATSSQPGAPGGNGRHQPEAFADTREDYRSTDVGNARRLVAQYGADLRYCYPWHTWLVWTGQRWEPDSTGEVERRAKAVLGAMFHEAADMTQKAAKAKSQAQDADGDKLAADAERLWKHAQKSEAAPRIVAMIEMARSEPEIPIDPSQLDAAPWLLNCRNGIVDLKTGQPRPHRREDYITRTCPLAFDPNAQLPLWDRFLAEAIPNAETRAYVQRCAGASLAGVTPDDLLLLVHGPGGTGKSTFLGALQAALGDYGASAELSTFTCARDAHGPQPDMARLRGRRMVVVTETDAGGASVSLLKRASGGDSLVTRSHHQDSYEFKPQWTLWLVGNERPRVPDTDTGLWRRLREIPFVTKFEKPDPTIRQQLTDPAIAGPAILAWAVQGCLAWQREGVGQLPKQVAQATEEYKRDMDPLAQWLEDCCVPEPSAWTAYKALYASYTTWAKDSGMKHPVGSKTFSQRLGTRLTERRGHGGRGYGGIVLLQDGDTPPAGGNGIWRDTSEVSRKASVPVGFQNQSFMGENPGVSVTKCHAESAVDTNTKCHPESSGRVT
ncbi:MAG: hypothetical protein HYY01_00680 [Chloroflexi bacterium]|nr:hypothetical protein [Chloroflexota bacterium]